MSDHYYANPDYAQDPAITADSETLRLASMVTDTATASDADFEQAVLEGHWKTVDAVIECARAVQEVTVLEDNAYWDGA